MNFIMLEPQSVCTPPAIKVVLLQTCGHLLFGTAADLWTPKEDASSDWKEKNLFLKPCLEVSKTHSEAFWKCLGH